MPGCVSSRCVNNTSLDLFASDEHVAFEVIWSVYQNMADTYREPATRTGKALMRAETNTLASTLVPCHQAELITLVRRS